MRKAKQFILRLLGRLPKEKPALRIVNRSNVIQFDCMGYPLRLCIVEDTETGKTSQEWVDTVELDDDVVLQCK